MTTTSKTSKGLLGLVFGILALGLSACAPHTGEFARTPSASVAFATSASFQVVCGQGSGRSVTIDPARGTAHNLSQLAYIMQDRTTGATRQPPQKLLTLLLAVQGNIGGDIKLHSGYRPTSAPMVVGKSRYTHERGQAIDFSSASGVPLATVWRATQQAIATHGGAAGFYPDAPNYFVHLDTDDGPSGFSSGLPQGKNLVWQKHAGSDYVYGHLSAGHVNWRL